MASQRPGGTLVSAVVTALAGIALWAPIASATFHLMNMREVYPGSAANPNAEYVELQMYESGQNLVGGHVLRTYNAVGAVVKANPMGADVPGDANQSTILLATPEAEAQFGIAADGALSPSGQLDPAGGAVCWEAIDCVSWGSFSGSLPSSAGAPASPSGIPDEMALRRTIAPGCATLLDPTDDRNNSAVDFLPAFPGPRPNSAAPSEHACGSSGPQAGSGPGVAGPPQTRLGRKPAKKTSDRTPSFRFSSDEAGSSFQCKFDGKPFKRCRSPFTARRLSLGHHVFRVRAEDGTGTLDPSPAAYAFELVSKPR
jgi:hypothetical protein